MPGSRVRIYTLDDAEACADFAAAQIVSRVAAAIASRGRCVIALAGSSTPKLLYARLAALPAGQISWPQVVLLWGDERDVPPDHADSNFRMVRETLLDRLPADQSPQVHRIPVGSQTAQAAADQYEATLRDLAAGAARLRLDLVLLGIGDDAHTASLFPHTAALDIADRAAVANWVEKLNTWRVTLTYPQLNNAADVFFLVCGQSKQEALRNIWDGPRDLERFPAQGIAPPQGTVHWLVDRAAASGLEETIDRLNR